MSQAVYPKFRRRHFLINKGMQSRFIGGFSLAVFFGILANLLVVYFLIDRELAAELYRIHLKVRTTSEIAWPILWKLSVVIVPVILIAAFFIGRMLTRRVETPLVEIMAAVKRTAHGDFTQSLDRDKLEHMPEAFNRMNSSLEKSLGVLQGASAGLDKGAVELDSLIGGGKPPSKAEVKRALDRISTKRAEAEKEVSRFKV
jgi:methyl-accepting chemotaxis protein